MNKINDKPNGSDNKSPEGNIVQPKRNMARSFLKGLIRFFFKGIRVHPTFKDSFGDPVVGIKAKKEF